MAKSKTTTVRAGAAKRRKPDGIDPRGNQVVLTYVGPRTIRYAPGRDLTGGDLARIGYHRRFQEAIDNGMPRPANDAGFADVEAIVEELVSTGNWKLAAIEPVAAEPETPTTTEPDPPAEAPEA